MLDQEKEKQLVGVKAVELIKSGNIVGLGTGSTIHYFLQELSKRIKLDELNDLVCVATSKDTELKATQLGINISSLVDCPVIDITVDGADEIDSNFNLIKGGGGALLREKIVAQASRELVIIADSSKRSEHLFEKFRLPVEVLKMALTTETQYLEALGAAVTLRKGLDGTPYITDEGNYLIDCEFSSDTDPYEIDEKLNRRAGIAEHGLFMNMADKVIIYESGYAKLFENSQEILKLK